MLSRPRKTTCNCTQFLQQRRGAAEVGDHDGAAHDQRHGEDLEQSVPDDAPFSDVGELVRECVLQSVRQRRGDV